MGQVVISLIIGSFLLNVIFYFLFRQHAKDLDNLERLYSSLAGATGIDNVVMVLSREIESNGMKVIGFYKRNRANDALVNGEEKIPLFKKGSAVKAFFTMAPCKMGVYHEIDQELAAKLGNDIVFIPIHMKKELPCWQINDCGKKCTAKDQSNGPCWIVTGKTYQGNELKDHDAKLRKCLECKAFLPIGVFAVQGKRITRIHNFINRHFSAALKNSVLYDEVVHDARTDLLTGVLNRRSLDDSLANNFKLAERHKYSLSVVMFDIDHFKRFNDEYGHQCGDMVLHELAQLVRKMVRETDVVARYGGEEFCLTFKGTDKASATEAAEKIRSRVEKTVFPTNKMLTISMGVSSFPEDDAEAPGHLIKKADIALYQSKSTRNRVTAYSPEFPDMKKQQEPKKKKVTSVK
ncbi:MAG: GGDEF domain-containing protein [Dissulfurispiraceae bacterium]